MIRILLLIVTSLTLAGGFTAAGQAQENSAEPARIVVYRADESSKTRKMKFQVRLDGESVGRLKYQRSLTILATPGEYALDTAITGTEPLRMNLLPGHTYYVHTRMKSIGQKVASRLLLVDPQVALAHQPELEQAI